MKMTARTRLVDVAVACPATKSVASQQHTRVNPAWGFWASAKVGEAVKAEVLASGEGVCSGVHPSGAFDISDIFQVVCRLFVLESLKKITQNVPMARTRTARQQPYEVNVYLKSA
jgi:hypothetical protein